MILALAQPQSDQDVLWFKSKEYETHLVYFQIIWGDQSVFPFLWHWVALAETQTAIDLDWP